MVLPPNAIVVSKYSTYGFSARPRMMYVHHARQQVGAVVGVCNGSGEPASSGTCQRLWDTCPHEVVSFASLRRAGLGAVSHSGAVPRAPPPTRRPRTTVPPPAAGL
jgi:hypothetical protein